MKKFAIFPTIFLFIIVFSVSVYADCMNPAGVEDKKICLYGNVAQCIHDNAGDDWGLVETCGSRGCVNGICTGSSAIIGIDTLFALNPPIETSIKGDDIGLVAEISIDEVGAYDYYGFTVFWIDYNRPIESQLTEIYAEDIPREHTYQRLFDFESANPQATNHWSGSVFTTYAFLNDDNFCNKEIGFFILPRVRMVDTHTWYDSFNGVLSQSFNYKCASPNVPMCDIIESSATCCVGREVWKSTKYANYTYENIKVASCWDRCVNGKCKNGILDFLIKNVVILTILFILIIVYFIYRRRR
jgi:hypothetical protein